MKRRKILVLIPMLGLFLTGCSFEEGFKTAKHWVGQHIYHPVKDWIEEKTGKKDEKKDDEKPTPAPSGDVAVTGVTVSPATLALTTSSADTTLTAIVAPSNASNKSVVWSVEQEGEVVSVSEAGVVHVLGVGTATVKATSAADSTKVGSCAVTVTEGVTPPAEGDGSAEHPYNVAQARGAATATAVEGVHVAGIIYKVDSFNSTHHSITYWISDTGTGNTANKDGLQIYGGLGIAGAEFASIDDLSIGDEVVVKGSLKLYNETTYELDLNSELVSINVPTVSKVEISGTAEFTQYAVGDPYSRQGLVATATLSNKVSVDVSKKASWTINPETASANDDSFVVKATFRGVESAGFEVQVEIVEEVEPTYHAATMTKGTTAYDDVTINGKNAIKLGSSKKGGDMTITVGEKSTKLRFYAVGWKGEGGESCPVTLSAGEGITITPNTFNPVANDSISGTATAFVLEDISAFFVEVELSGVDAESQITLTSTKRAIVFEAEYFA